MNKRVTILISFDDRGFKHKEWFEFGGLRDGFAEHIEAISLQVSSLHKQGGGIATVYNARTIAPCTVMLNVSEQPPNAALEREQLERQMHARDVDPLANWTRRWRRERSCDSGADSNNCSVRSRRRSSSDT